MSLFKLIGLAFQYRAWWPVIQQILAAVTKIIEQAVRDGVPSADKVLTFLESAQDDQHDLTPEQQQAAIALGEKLRFDRATGTPDTSGGP